MLGSVLITCGMGLLESETPSPSCAVPSSAAVQPIPRPAVCGCEILCH